MSFSYYIGEFDDVFISTEYWYAKFIEWAYGRTFIMQKPLPNILEHHPYHGNYELDYKGEVKEFTGSIAGLLGELQLLKKQNPPEYASDILDSMIEACDLAKKKKVKITLDNGAYDRSIANGSGSASKNS